MLARGLALLSALGNHPHGATVTDVAREVGLPVSTVYRLLATEVALGFIAFEPSNKTYCLGVKVFELAHKVTGVVGLAESARPIMQDLSRLTGETVQLSVLSGHRALFIEKVGTEQSVGIRGSVGESEPVHCTSTGKVLISQLPPETLDKLLDGLAFESYGPTTITDRAGLLEELALVRAQEYATANEEFDTGVRAIGVPVRNGRGETRAALCISAPAFRVSSEQLLAWLPELRQAAHEIGIRLPLAATS